MSVQIISADVFDGLARLDRDSVNCVVTSPPYWGLRDYGYDGQIGLEPTLGEHLDVLVRVFREVRRVLRPDGTVWLNYGDCYATTPAGNKDIPHGERFHAKRDDRTFVQKPFSTVGPIYSHDHEIFPSGRRGGGNAPAGGVLKPKDLCMAANRLAIALQEDGWYVRSEIVWAKPNPMPESVKDRPTSSHEKIWLLSKSPKYYFDSLAVREPDSGQDHQRNVLDQPEPSGGVSSPHCGIRTREGRNGLGRNIRNVWHVPSRGFPGAHFATFPTALAEKCVLAGCPAGGVVLDPFAGAGTTGLVADRLDRDAFLIEASQDYCEIISQRLGEDAPLLSTISFADETPCQPAPSENGGGS